MKIWKKAPISCSLAVIFLIGLIFSSQLQFWAALRTESLSSFDAWGTLLTYIVPHASIGHWLSNAPVIVAMGLCLEKRISNTYMVILIISSIITGGLLACLLFPPDIYFIGSSPIVCAYAGCLFACYLAENNGFSNLERIFTIALIVYAVLTIPSWILSCGLYENESHIMSTIILVAALIITRVSYGKIIRIKANQGMEPTSANAQSIVPED